MLLRACQQVRPDIQYVQLSFASSSLLRRSFCQIECDTMVLRQVGKGGPKCLTGECNCRPVVFVQVLGLNEKHGLKLTVVASLTAHVISGDVERKFRHGFGHAWFRLWC